MIETIISRDFGTPPSEATDFVTLTYHRRPARHPWPSAPPRDAARRPKAA